MKVSSTKVRNILYKIIRAFPFTRRCISFHFRLMIYQAFTKKLTNISCVGRRLQKVVASPDSSLGNLLLTGMDRIDS